MGHHIICYGYRHIFLTTVTVPTSKKRLGAKVDPPPTARQHGQTLWQNEPYGAPWLGPGAGGSLRAVIWSANWILMGQAWRVGLITFKDYKPSMAEALGIPVERTGHFSRLRGSNAACGLRHPAGASGRRPCARKTWLVWRVPITTPIHS